MRSKVYKNIIWFGFALMMIFAPLAKGAMRVWSTAIVELIVLMLVFLWLLRFNNSSRKDYKFRKTKLDLPIWLFVGLAGISCFFSIYKHDSLIEMMRLLTMVGVFYLVVNNFDRYMSVRLGVLVIIMGAGMSLFGLGQYFLGLNHDWWIPEGLLAATYVNHNHFTGYLELAIPLAVAMIIFLKSDALTSRFRTGVSRIGLILALIIMLTALIFSQSRAGWVSLLASLVIMNIILVKKKILKKEALIIFLLLISIGIAYIYSGYDAISERIATVEQINKEGFIETRKNIWQGSLDMIKDNPLIGTGIGTFIWGLPQYRPQKLGILSKRARFAHNEYLHMMAEMGILALVPMIWMIGVVVKSSFRYVNKEFNLMEGVILGSGVGILSLALHGLVDFNFQITANMLVIASLSGIIARSVGNK